MDEELGGETACLLAELVEISVAVRRESLKMPGKSEDRGRDGKGSSRGLDVADKGQHAEHGCD